MKILLSRHGNTFSPGEPVVCAGAQNDLPLVASGKTQAEKLAEYLKQLHIIPAAIYCSPLQRTIEYAQIVIDRISQDRDTMDTSGATHASPLRPTIDPRLNELDYGDWTGLTTPEIIAKFGHADFEHWEKNSQWPTMGNWGSSEKEIIQDVLSFATELSQQYTPDDTVLVITSNGRLRYFLTLIPNAFEQHIQTQTFKVATGNICEVNYQNKRWSINFWNIHPRP